jgi:NAD+ synthase (glutamine-hydrolysing)
MAFPLRVALGQIDTTVGDFDGNAGLVREATVRARAEGAELVAFPELTLTGYPPRDLLELSDFLQRGDRALAALAAPAEWSRGVTVVIGFAERHGGPGVGVYNSAAAIQDGRVTLARKLLLPSYDVFDETRTFDPGEAPTRFIVAGRRVGLTICEDVWNDKSFWPRPRYARDPVEELCAQGIDLLLNISASPYSLGRRRQREEMLGAVCRRHRIPLAYVNLVGGNDSVIFDGSSLMIDAGGKVVSRGRAFEPDLVQSGPAVSSSAPPAEGSDEELEELARALVLGLQDYARKTGFRGALLGLSGGIDSALAACLAVKAFGAAAVRGVAMPSRFSAAISLEDARALALALKIQFEVLPIEEIHAAYLEVLETAFAGAAPDVTEENIQSRIRGALLMALSNKSGQLLLSTGNKSELSVGYCTLYGDMAGGLAAIGDVPKTLVYRLARHLNQQMRAIPERTFTRPPTAELRPGQTDQDSLPPYEVLDRVMQLYVEERLSPEQIAERGIARSDVDRIIGLLVRSEYKRRQAAPVLRVSRRAFGEGWRFPIATAYRPSKGRSGQSPGAGSQDP